MKGTSKETVSKNVKTVTKHGKSQKQAAVIGSHQARQLGTRDRRHCVASGDGDTSTASRGGYQLQRELSAALG
jgi:hypothetical protein